MQDLTPMSGRAAFLALLADEGVTHLFGDPGTTELPIIGAALREAFRSGQPSLVDIQVADGFGR